MQDNRLVWADSLKGWLMILVILGHAIQGVMPEACFHDHLWNLIYSFHMPAFMAVSGFFACRGRRCGGGGKSHSSEGSGSSWCLTLPGWRWA